MEAIKTARKQGCLPLWDAAVGAGAPIAPEGPSPGPALLQRIPALERVADLATAVGSVFASWSLAADHWFAQVQGPPCPEFGDPVRGALPAVETIPALPPAASAHPDQLGQELHLLGILISRLKDYYVVRRRCHQASFVICINRVKASAARFRAFLGALPADAGRAAIYDDLLQAAQDIALAGASRAGQLVATAESLAATLKAKVKVISCKIYM